jgi:hypothetical protein
MVLCKSRFEPETPIIRLLLGSLLIEKLSKVPAVKSLLAFNQIADKFNPLNDVDGYQKKSYNPVFHWKLKACFSMHRFIHHN